MSSPEWADHVCVECGAVTYGPVGATECAHGHPAAPMEVAPALCPERPDARLSACVRAAGHEGSCVFVRGARQGRRKHGLWYYQDGKTVLIADMRGATSTRREAAVLYAWLEMRAARPRLSGGG